MIYWIKRLARIFSLIAFLMVFTVSYAGNGFNMSFIFIPILKGMAAGFVFWFTGFIIADIVLKGAVETIPDEKLEENEGGLVVRTKEAARKNTLPVRLRDQREASGKGKEEKGGKKKVDKGQG